MGVTGSPGLCLLYNSAVGGAIASGNTNIVSSNFSLSFSMATSVQILTDGGAIVDWILQVTDISSDLSRYGVTWAGKNARDDSYTSGMWAPVQSGTIAAGGTARTAMIVLASSPHKSARVLLAWDAANTGGATAKVLVNAHGIGI